MRGLACSCDVQVEQAALRWGGKVGAAEGAFAMSQSCALGGAPTRAARQEDRVAAISRADLAV